MDQSHLSLSDREREIVLLAAEGLGDKEIANKLGIAEGTVRTYWDRLRPKIGATNRAQATAQLLVALFKDSEKVRQAEANRGNLILENLKDFAIFSIDLERKIDSWNPGVRQVLGFESEDWIGKSAEIIFTPEDCANNIPDWEIDTAAAHGRAEDERWHLRKDRTRFWGSGVMISLREPDGALVGYAKILRDYTDKMRFEDRIRQLEGELLRLKSPLR